MRQVATVLAIASLLVWISVPLNACSAAACAVDGVEADQDFAVLIKHSGKPLAGVAVEITAEGRERFSGVTSEDGKVHVNLPPGHYWLKARLLGITAAYECFHINQQSSTKAKRTFAYDWGDLAPATRRIAGKLVDLQRGRDGTPLWNLLHPTEVPISGASLRLQDPVTGAAYTTMSDSSGGFGFDLIPTNTYVLHIEGGKAGIRDYDAADLLVAVDPKASRDEVIITRQDPGGGNCGGTSLEVRSAD